MRRLRTRKSLVLFGIGVIVFAGILPGFGTTFTAILTPLWVMVPTAVVLLCRTADETTEYPVPLLSSLLSRAPPVLALA